ncbi:putative ribonuclease H-like domain-containing protein [Tanacetum coccineum]
MDLFGPTFVRIINHKIYCLVVTDDYSRFSWVFFLATKDETSGILKAFITRIENQLNHKVKIIRCDNGTEFKNNDMNQFRGMKGIKREFSAEAVNTACYVKNRVLVTKPHNKILYELLLGKLPCISFMRPFGCPVTILNTLDPLGKFDRKADEGFLVGYSINCKALRVFNTRTRKVEENLHIKFLEKKPNVAGSGPEWLFDIDSLTKSINYKPVTAENQTNGDADDKDADEVPDKGDDDVSQRNGQEKEKGASNKEDDQHVQGFRVELDNLLIQQKEGYANSTNRDSTVSLFVSTVGPSINTSSENINTGSPNINTTSPIPNDSSMHSLENTGIFDDAYDNREVGAEADLNNLETTMNEPKKVIQALDDPSWIEAMQEELLQFKLQKVFKNKKDERGIVIRNKARLVAQGYTQEEGIDYDEVFAPVARIEAIRLFLAYASFIGFIVYQMDVKSDFLYGTIEEEVYVCQPPGFENPQFPDKVYKKDDGIFISQDKYVVNILKKFDFITIMTASTPIETNKALLKYEEAKEVDVHLYRSMIGSLMYLTASRPDIMFAVCACARDSPFDLEAFSDSDYAGASLDRKSTTGGHHFIRDSYEKKLVQVIKSYIDHNVADLLTKAFDVSRTKRTTKISQSSRPIHLVADETVYKEWEDRMERAATTASSLESEQDSDAQTRIGVDTARHKLNTASIKYALTESPTIYVSLIEQFWQTTSASTLENGDKEITATIDGKVKVISEASIRRHLKLEDSDGISTLPTSEIFEQLALMGVCVQF